ncbi:unnamed protein product, partial [Rotaria magnacalcarata]
MNDSTTYNGRSRPRAQSLFEYRSQSNAEITVTLLDRLIASQAISSASNETTDCSDQADIIIR